jgi:hypothetical protein
MINTFQLYSIAKNNPEGFTIDKNTGKPMTKGFAVAVNDTQNSFGGSQLETVLNRANKDDIQALGGWYNSKDGQYYFDAVKVLPDIEQAINEGIRENQMAIFDLNNMTEIRLDKVAANQ